MNDHSDLTRKAAKTAVGAFAVLGPLVLLLGVVLAAISIWAGFHALEPWAWNSVPVTDDWKSVLLGFVGAAYFLISAGVVWAFMTLGAAIAEDLLYKHDRIDRPGRINRVDPRIDPTV